MSSLRQAAEHANIMMLSRSNEELSSPSVCLGNLIMPVIRHSKIHMTSPVGFMTELCMGLFKDTYDVSSGLHDGAVHGAEW